MKLSKEERKTLENYNKQLISLQAYYQDKSIIPELIQALSLYPKDNSWNIWIDGNNNAIKIGKDIKTIKRKNNFYFDLYFSCFSREFYSIIDSAIVYKKRGNVLFFAMCNDKKLRTAIAFPNFKIIPPLTFDFNFLLKVYQALKNESVPVPEHKTFKEGKRWINQIKKDGF